MANAPSASFNREPNSLEAEQAVLGSVLADSKNLYHVISRLVPDDFYYPNHRDIYISMQNLASASAPIDIISLANDLDRRQILDKVGGVKVLSDLSNFISIHNTEYYVDLVKQNAQLRQLIKAFRELQAYCYGEEAEVEQVINMAAMRLQQVRGNERAGDFERVGEVIMAQINELMEMSKQEKSPLQETGFASLDQKLGGLRKGALYILAARPGMGKSAFAFNIAQRVASIYQVPTAIFSLEMSSQEVSSRFLSTYSMIESEKLNTADLSQQEWTRLSEKAADFFPTPIFINDRPAIGPMEMLARCRELKLNEPDLGLVIVDYLQLMSSDRSRADGRQQEISDISRNLKIMARELDVPVLALSQLSRACEARSNKRPMLSDLRDSGAIEQDADVVLFLYRDAYYPDDEAQETQAAQASEQAELIIAKNRQGATGTVYLGWRPEYTLFYDLDPRTENREAPPF